MIAAELYGPIFYNLLLLLMIRQCFVFIQRQESGIVAVDKNRDFDLIFIFAILLAVFLGFRPISGFYFGDTSTYAARYEFLQQGATIDIFKKDVLFNILMLSSSKIMNVHWFFFVVELLYIGCALLAIRRFFPGRNTWIAFLVFISAFSFYSYGINGLRNGLATSFFLLGLSCMNRRWPAFLLMAVAIGFHKTMLLPAGAVLLSLLYKNSRAYMWVWLLAILVSLVAGGWFEGLFANLGFDDRASYFTMDEYDDQFSSTGFRWDFLLYSAVPVAIGYYVIFKRRITSKFYTFLLNTYLISNTFWILVIRAAFSNRFAYLSWFLFPIVLLYPFVHFNIWKNRDKAIILVTLLHFAFTYFMWLIGR